MDLSAVLDYLVSGNVLAAFGAAAGMILAGFGSAKGLSMSGSTAAALTAEQEKNFGPILILEALPQTQCIYGFVIAFLIASGMMGGDMTVEKGFLSLAAGLTVGLTGLTAVLQGSVASAAVGAFGKNNNITSKVIMYVVMVEISALLGFIISILILQSGGVF
ncbi:MAG: V-type ATP synthase subunit K [Candidatus Altiarchaeales archaeon]|nr:V-type ATP synthase subunit K [Candidatus Altiarchaeales archaeon]MBD3415828.1 V-type ATP synthase subunit K [Candidatus Altiarchaeales archaeon]